METTRLTRRTLMQSAAAAATLGGAPFVRGAHAAGKLSFGVWDHWVPKESEVIVKLCNEWAAKEKVDITVDLITSNGDKDVLTLTATPIPRTLHMSLTGIRDVSIIQTPPEGRLPIRTHLQPYQDRLVREAIIRELEREGQVFFVHNRVAGIEALARIDLTNSRVFNISWYTEKMTE